MSDQPLWLQVIAWLTDSANWHGPSGVGTRLIEHIGMSALALGIATVIAMPIGLWLGGGGRGQFVVVNIANAGRAVPVYALLVLLAIGPLGLSLASTVIALVLFGIPPILTNTYTGVREVDPDVVDAAHGMGLSAGQVMGRVQVPLATPLMLTGLRLASVQIVATATIAALVAGGGLGRLITAGFATQDRPQLLAGAILVAGLALAVESLFAWLAARSARRTGAVPTSDGMAGALVGPG